jgi:enediyne biosynthesis protein E3
VTFSPLRWLRKAILRTVPSASGSDQRVVTTVMQGFRATLEDDRFDVLVARINEVEEDWRGFAYEGVGLGLTVFDYFLPWRKRLQAFVAGPGEAYIIPIYIGAGLAFGRLGGGRIEWFVRRLEHPVFRWMVVDGYGFYRGFFARQRFLIEQEVPKNLTGYAHRVFDQGMGRSIWFANGEDVARVVSMIGAFPEARRADLWAGASFACAYAGSPMTLETLEQLRAAAAPYQSQLAVAATLAAKRRHGFGHLTPHIELACQVFCGLSGEMAAKVANDALENIPFAQDASPYQTWRQRIVTHFDESAVQSANEPFVFSQQKEQ